MAHEYAQSFHGVGRRKSSVARVWLTPNSSSFVINDKELESYFFTEIARQDASYPLSIVSLPNGYGIKVIVNGGGMTGQSQAIKLALSRALLAFDETQKKTLRDAGLLTVDARKVERKKYGQRKARRKFQFVKR